MRVFICTVLALSASLCLAQDDRSRAFQLESTVGLDSTCSAERNISLAAGNHIVTVCLNLRNEGASTMYLHQIVSEQLGVLETDALYTLPAGQSVFYTYPVRLTATTGLVSRWQSLDLAGRRYCKTAWSVVSVGDGALTGSRPPLGDLVCEP